MVTSTVVTTGSCVPHCDLPLAGNFSSIVAIVEILRTFEDHEVLAFTIRVPKEHMLVVRARCSENPGLIGSLDHKSLAVSTHAGLERHTASTMQVLTC